MAEIRIAIHHRCSGRGSVVSKMRIVRDRAERSASRDRRPVWRCRIDFHHEGEGLWPICGWQRSRGASECAGRTKHSAVCKSTSLGALIDTKLVCAGTPVD